MSLSLIEIYISETNQIMEDMSVDLRIFYDCDISEHIIEYLHGSVTPPVLKIYVSQKLTTLVTGDQDVILYGALMCRHVLKHCGESSKVHVQEKPSGVYTCLEFDKKTNLSLMSKMGEVSSNNYSIYLRRKL